MFFVLGLVITVTTGIYQTIVEVGLALVIVVLSSVNVDS